MFRTKGNDIPMDIPIIPILGERDNPLLETAMHIIPGGCCSQREEPECECLSGGAGLTIESTTPAPGKMLVLGRLERIPFHNRAMAWGNGVCWDDRNNRLRFSRAGVYFADWHIQVARNGSYPCLITLETPRGYIMGRSGDAGDTVHGSAAVRVCCGTRLCLVNRSAGPIGILCPGDSNAYACSTLTVVRADNS